MAERLNRLFLRELNARKIAILEQSDDGHYTLDIRGQPVSVALDELAYDFERDVDPQLVARFVSALVDPPAPLPTWQKARSRVFLLPESSGDETDEYVRLAVTRLFSLSVVHADELECVLTPVTACQLETWHVSKDDVVRAARANLASLLEDTVVDIARIGSVTTGTFATRSVFKPALIFSPNLKQKVTARLGWPVLALAPCRESVFLIPENSMEADSKESMRFLHFMVQEYLESRYSITPEVLRVSDDGVESVGMLGMSEEQ